MRDVTTADKLIATRVLELLGPNGENWIQHGFTRDKNNKPVDMLLDRACKFCLLAAIVKTTNEMQISDYHFTFTNKIIAITKKNIADWNDASKRKFSEVRELMEQFI